MSGGGHAMVDRSGGEFGAIGQIKLAEDVREVRLDRAAAHEQAGADLRVGEPFGDLADDLELRRSKARPARGRAASAAAGAADVVDGLGERQSCTLGGRA